MSFSSSTRTLPTSNRTVRAESEDSFTPLPNTAARRRAGSEARSLPPRQPRAKTTTTSSLPPPRPRHVRAGSEVPAPPRHVRAGSEAPSLKNTTSYSSTDDDDELDDDTKLGPIRILTYDDRNHFSVLTQLYGSVWPHVLPFCIVNMCITLVVFYFLKDYTFAPAGHHFMSMILSFLVVSRAKITYSRFMEARGYLEECYKSCRELVQHMCVLTQEDVSEGAQVWRHNVAYRTILLLRVTMAAIEFESQHSNPWEIPELTQTDQQDMTEMLFLQDFSTRKRSSIKALQHSDKDHFLREECFRAPLLLAYALRKEIMEQRSGAFLEKEFDHVNEELKLLDCVTEFLKAFHGLGKLVETPFPFPLVQMTRTFLFVWVFTLSLVLCHDNTSRYPFDALLMIFLTTFGFIGMNIVVVIVIIIIVVVVILTLCYYYYYYYSVGIEFVCMVRLLVVSLVLLVIYTYTYYSSTLRNSTIHLVMIPMIWMTWAWHNLSLRIYTLVSTN